MICTHYASATRQKHELGGASKDASGLQGKCSRSNRRSRLRQHVRSAHQSKKSGVTWARVTASSQVWPERAPPYSHSIVPGGLLVTSYTTRLTPFTSLMIRVAVAPRKLM